MIFRLGVGGDIRGGRIFLFVCVQKISGKSRYNFGGFRSIFEDLVGLERDLLY